MPSLKKKRNTYYAVFKDSKRTPKEKWVPLRTRLKSAAKLKFNDLQRREADPNDPFDPWIACENVPKNLTLQEAISAFLESRSHKRGQTVRMYRSYLGQWSRALPPGLLLSSITSDHIRPYLWEEGLKPNSLRARGRHLKAFYSWAVKAGHLQRNPMDDVEMPRKEKKVPVYVTPDDVERILRAVQADYQKKAAQGQAQPGEILWLKEVIAFAVSTGLRRSEICSLQWEAVNRSDRVLTVGVGHATKSHHQRPVPLAVPAVEILERLHSPGATGYVFRGQKGGKLNGDYLGKRFKYYVRLAGLSDDVKFHSLRDTCASWLVMNGVPLRVVQEILGHSSITVTERYAHLAPGVMRAAMDDTFSTLSVEETN